MKFIRFFAVPILLTLPVTLPAADFANYAYPPRMNWWLQARYGMFIHWNMSNVDGIMDSTRKVNPVRTLDEVEDYFECKHKESVLPVRLPDKIQTAND